VALVVRPLTPAVWPALEELFGERGAWRRPLVHVLAQLLKVVG